MGTVLNTFTYDRKKPNWRDRYTEQIVQVGPVNKDGQLSGNLAYGSYRRIIDKKDDYLFRSVRNWKRRHLKPPIFIDTGGPLWMEEYSISKPAMYSVAKGNESWSGPLVQNSNHWGAYTGLAAKQPIQPRMGLTGVSFSEMVQAGSTGISRAIPTIPETSVFTILGELREGLASVPGRQTWKMIKESPKWANRVQILSKSAGSEFLNWIFGIMPTVKDVEALMVINTDDAIKARDKLYSEVNKSYRRRRVIRNDVTQTVTQGSAYPQYTGTINLFKEGSQRTVTTVQTVIWFEGKFDHSAWRPTIDNRINALLNKAESLGFLPNAERIWQLVPYSWLIDWFLGTGEFLTNISYLGHGGLHMLYGYVMADTRRVITTTWSGKVNNSFTSCSTTSEERIRQRIKASPYGFGLKIRDLSPIQLAILASLGITRTKLLKTGAVSA